MITLTTSQSERGAHRIGLASTCLRKYAYRIQDAVQTGSVQSVTTSVPLIQGTMLHLALAHHYAHKAFRDGAKLVDACDMTINDPAQVYTPIEALIEQSKIMAHWYEHLSVVETAYREYCMTYGAETNWQVLAVEQQLRARIPGLDDDRSLYTQRADLIVRDKATSKVFIVDHKKAYAIISKTADQYILHGQFLGYQRLGAMQYSDAFGGVILNRIRLHPTEYQRSMIGSAPAAVDGYVRQLRSIEQMIEQCEATYGPPGTNAHSWPGAFHEETCFGKHGKCDYFDKCRFGN